MKRIVLVGLVLLLLSGLGGCSGHLPVDAYVPQNEILYSNPNPLDMDHFTYESIATKKMKPNQLENTAVGNVYLSSTVAELVRDATALELRKGGFAVSDKADLSIGGDVLEFQVDDLGYSIHWTYGIRYKILRKSTGETLFSREYTPPMLKTRKLFASLATFRQFVHKVVLSGYDMFIRDEEARKILEGGEAAPPLEDQSIAAKDK